MERCVIVDYGSGNIRSVENAFLKAADTAGLALQVDVSADPETVARADRLVLPGVGAYGDCAKGIQQVAGLWEVLDEAVTKRATPFFGICVGMQLMAERGEEHGDHAGFGWVKGRVTALDCSTSPSLKLPQMGWNALDLVAQHPVLEGIQSGDHVYFVHSYAMTGDIPLLAQVNYGGPVTALIGHGSFIGSQFHPEKSQGIGLKIIENFLRWHP